jgi:predicted RecB family nuclease
LNQQARLQLQARRTGEHSFELLPREKDRGFNRLPLPSAGDLFLDLEGDPFLGDGLTYLFGAAWEEQGKPEYHPWWAHDPSEERRATEAVVDFLTERCGADPSAHVYHYGPIEVSTLKRLVGRHGTREGELDDLLRREVFVDLSAVVRQGMRISHSGYGLKKVETFYYTRQGGAVADAGGAVLAYERWLETRDDGALEQIQAYNREDCLSLLKMQRWLMSIRPEDATWQGPQEAQAGRESHRGGPEGRCALPAVAAARQAVAGSPSLLPPPRRAAGVVVVLRAAEDGRGRVDR